MEKSFVTPQKLVSELSKSPHGKLSEYVPTAKLGFQHESLFMQHLIAWNHKVGQIRDSKVALPVIALGSTKEPEFLDNAFAHIASLGPRELLRAYTFAREIRPVGQMLPFRRLIGTYLAEKEADKGWDHLAIQHRKTLKELYALSHARPEKDRTRAVLFGKDENKNSLPLPKGSVFEAVANLKNMSPIDAAGTILKFRIPFLIAMGALGAKAKDTDLVMALIDRMSATELVTNTKMLEKLGVKTNPALRAKFEAGLAKAATSKKNSLKTTAAIDAISDEGLKNKLRGLQDKQIALSGGPEGDWLVLADKSPSMASAMEFAKHVSASLSAYVKGKVHLVFFDSQPLVIDVTGLSLDQIQKATKHIRTGSATSIGVGLNRMLVENVEVDGIAIISDGEENTAPRFADVYSRYCTKFDKIVPVYFYDCKGGSDNLSASMDRAGHEMQKFDLRHGTADYYAIPNLVQTMRASQYSLTDEIMATPLLSLSDVLKTSNKLVAA
ncbi:unnamed protein product [Sphagnum jensenii]